MQAGATSSGASTPSSTSCPSASRASAFSRRFGRAPRPSQPDPEQLEQVVDLIGDVLGTEVLGAYLYGSALTGGLRPRSDIDVLVLTRRAATIEEKRRLAEGLLAVGQRPRPVEVTVVAEPDVKPWRYPPRFDLQFGEWHRAALERAEVEPLAATTNPDVAMLLTMVLQASRPLLGPPAPELLDPVPPEDLTRAMLHGVEEVMPGLADDTRNSVLTLARIWLTVETGEIGPKDRAADWVLERLPEEHREVLARARAIYLGQEDERWDDLRQRVRPYADHVAGEIRRRAAPAAS
jgi:streptomycin 3"-adenylyltransferase